MQIGQYLQRVSIETQTEVSDGHDGFVSTWAPVWSHIPASVTPLVGRDLENARQIDPRAALRLEVRYWPTYPADLAGGRARITFHDGAVGDRQLEIIEPPRETVHRQVLTMHCREAV